LLITLPLALEPSCLFICSVTLPYPLCAREMNILNFQKKKKKKKKVNVGIELPIPPPKKGKERKKK